jgi:hypothetical protein
MSKLQDAYSAESGIRITMRMTERKCIRKISEEKHIYNIIYSGFLKMWKRGCKTLKTKARLAGLEPATPCLEGRCSIL